MAWALLEVIETHGKDIPDVVITLNCRDKPTYWYPDGPQPQGSYERATTAVPRDGKPALAFSYTTGHTFSDVPVPDATFWGLPYARIRPWEQWLASTAAVGSPSRWESKRDEMLWVGTTGVGNGKLGFSSHPLRARFAKCGPATFGGRLRFHGVAKEAIDRIAWKCKPGECDDWQPEGWLSLEEQCRYRIILHLPGVSDWLEHFKHQLSCGALNIYLTEVKSPERRDPRREAEVKPPLTAPLFEHFDWWAPLLQPNVHYVHVPVRLQRGRRDGGEVCEALQAALAELEATPGRARCIAERGQQLARSLTMGRVREYFASILKGAAAVQRPDLAAKVLAAHAHPSAVTKRNLLKHVAPDTHRPWMEHIFYPMHGVNVTRDMIEPAPASKAFTFHR